MLVSQNMGTVAILVYKATPLRVELFLFHKINMAAGHVSKDDPFVEVFIL